MEKEEKIKKLERERIRIDEENKDEEEKKIIKKSKVWKKWIIMKKKKEIEFLRIKENKVGKESF